jgi:hypothetical protein
MLTTTDIVHALNWSWAGLNFLSWWHTCILFIWPFFAFIVGFSNGTFLHMVPLAYEIFVLKVVSVAINGFGVTATVDKRDIKTKQQVIVLSCIVLIVAICFNLAHAIYTLVDTFGNALTIDSTLYWFLIVFSIVLLVLALLEAIMVYYLAKLRQHIGLLVKVQ